MGGSPNVGRTLPVLAHVGNGFHHILAARPQREPQQIAPAVPAKGCDLAAVTDEQLQAIDDKLNDRTEKRLGFRTPRQVFEASLNHRALRS